MRVLDCTTIDGSGTRTSCLGGRAWSLGDRLVDHRGCWLNPIVVIELLSPSNANDTCGNRNRAGVTSLTVPSARRPRVRDDGPGTQPSDRAWHHRQRLPASDGPSALPRLHGATGIAGAVRPRPPTRPAARRRCGSAASTSETTNILPGWLRAEDGKRRAHVNRRDTRKATASPPLTGGAAAVASGDRLCAAVRRGQCALGRLPLISGVNRQCRRQAGSSPRRRPPSPRRSACQM
jgi:hypothetical protein